MILPEIIAVIFILFIICFIAIIIEETFIGGRRKRKLEQQLRDKRAASPAEARAVEAVARKALSPKE